MKDLLLTFLAAGTALAGMAGLRPDKKAGGAGQGDCIRLAF